VILLDTHALIWLAREPAKLSKVAVATIRKSGEEGGLAISAITLWELAWLATHGRLQIKGTVESFLDKISSRTSIQPITIRVAAIANQLPEDYPADPCDRIIGATAIADGMALVTKDKGIRSCRQIRTIW
jgi:PIN domain nuclease of toxin-antitoxin system